MIKRNFEFLADLDEELTGEMNEDEFDREELKGFVDEIENMVKDFVIEKELKDRSLVIINQGDYKAR